MTTRATGHPSRAGAVTTFIVTNVCALIAWLYFFVLNRAEIVRPYRGTDRPNLILVSNHQSPLDTCLIALAAFFPRLLLRPRLHPWSIAAAEYWFSNGIIAWLARHLRCLPARAGIRDASAVRRLCRVLPNGMTIFFPEGRRSPDGIVARGLPGAGFVARATRARIVPVAIDGLLEAMPYHRPWPRIGKRLAIAFGDPVPCEDLFA
ncbi:MAG TPA: lysophospholipid acyltransferase family protein, partial [Gemmatimonadales bacterium]